MSAASLTIRQAGFAEALPFVQMAAQYPTTTEQAEDILRAGQAFIISQGGADVAGFVVQRQKDEIFVLAAGGRAGFDLSVCIDEVVEHLRIPGIRSVAFQTARPGLVAKAKRRGYQVGGYILRKVYE